MAKQKAVEPEPKEAEQTAMIPVKSVPPVRLVECELDEPYSGWKFTVNKNFTIGQLEDLTSGFYYRTRDALKLLVTGWSGFVSVDGKPIEFPNFDGIVVDAIVLMGYKTAGVSTSIPNR